MTYAPFSSLYKLAFWAYSVALMHVEMVWSEFRAKSPRIGLLRVGLVPANPYDYAVGLVLQSIIDAKCITA